MTYGGAGYAGDGRELVLDVAVVRVINYPQGRRERRHHQRQERQERHDVDQQTDD